MQFYWPLKTTRNDFIMSSSSIPFRVSAAIPMKQQFVAKRSKRRGFARENAEEEKEEEEEKKVEERGRGMRDLLRQGNSRKSSPAEGIFKFNPDATVVKHHGRCRWEWGSNLEGRRVALFASACFSFL